MRTIGRRWPKSAPRGDYVAMCDYCGTHWRRSKLKKDRTGLLYCPQEGNGRDWVTLAEESADQAMDQGPSYSYYDGGKYDDGWKP